MEFKILRDTFTIIEAKQLNPLVLAYIGDAVYEVFVRTFLINLNREASVHKLHKKAIYFVKAQAQSGFAKKLVENLNEEELSIYKRGRNAKSATMPKNADVVEYRMATGLECLIGFLYLTEQTERLEEILVQITKWLEE